MVKLTDREKKSIKLKYDKIVKLGTDTGMPVSKVKSLLSDSIGSLPEIYGRAEEKKDKFKGGVPGGFDRFFSKEMNQADKLIKKEKRMMQEGVYDPKKDKLVRKGPRGNKRFI
jgi:hypothetical protein